MMMVCMLIKMHDTSHGICMIAGAAFVESRCGSRALEQQHIDAVRQLEF